MVMQLGFDNNGNYGYGVGIGETKLNSYNLYNLTDYHNNFDSSINHHSKDINNNFDKKDNHHKNEENNNKNDIIIKKINQYSKFLTTGIEITNIENDKVFILIKNIEEIFECRYKYVKNHVLIKCYNDDLNIKTYESYESIIKKYKDAVASIEE